MNKLTVASLQKLALHCGYRADTTKAARINAIESSVRLFRQILAHAPENHLNVLSVDVGIKHFSYCKTKYFGSRPTVDCWTVVNLHEKFGSPHHPESTSLVDSKAYMAKLAVCVVDSIFLSSSWSPSVITIENQRTRSNSNKITLPNVLLNFTLEHMLYAAFAARQAQHTALANTVVIPMNSNKMVNFWLSRFLPKQNKMSSALSKKLRTNLLYGWLQHPDKAPFDLSTITTLPPDFDSLRLTRKNAVLKSALGIHNDKLKIDDLVDSLLYNITIAKQLQRHSELMCVIEKNGYDTIPDLLAKWDAEHLKYLDPLLSSAQVQIAAHS